MTDDIVPRLRYKQRLHERWDAVDEPLFGDAADEIVHLRSTIALMKAFVPAELLERLEDSDDD